MSKEPKVVELFKPDADKQSMLDALAVITRRVENGQVDGLCLASVGKDTEGDDVIWTNIQTWKGSGFLMYAALSYLHQRYHDWLNGSRDDYRLDDGE